MANAVSINRRTGRGKGFGVDIEGIDELMAQLGKIAGAETGNKIADAVKEAVVHTADVIREEAPQGPTGNLKRGVEAELFKKRSGRPIGGFARVNAKVAPHAHLVEFGARGGNMPANAFFSRGYRKAKSRAEQIVSEGVSDAIDKAIR